MKLVFAALLLVGTLVGCKKPAPPAPPVPTTQVKIAVAKSALSLPMFVAMQEGFFAKAGVVVEPVECLSGRECLDLLLNDTVQVATVGEVPFMFSAFERTDLTIFGTITRTATDVKLIAATKADITTPQSLVGKRIGVVPRTTSQYYVDTYLLLNGVDPKSLTTVLLKPDEMLPALRDDTVDAIAIWEPFGNQVLTELGSNAKVFTDSGVYTATFNLASKQNGVSEETQLAILRAVEEAEQLIISNPALAKATFSQATGISPSVIEDIWDNYQYHLDLTKPLVRTLEDTARWAQRQNYVTNPVIPHFRAFLNDAPLKKMQPYNPHLDE